MRLWVLTSSVLLTAAGCTQADFPLDTTGGQPGVITQVSGEFSLSDDCPQGGVLINYGIDENANGELDPSEVDGTAEICHGTAGAPGVAGEDGAPGNDGDNGICAGAQPVELLAVSGLENNLTNDVPLRAVVEVVAQRQVTLSFVGFAHFELDPWDDLSFLVTFFQTGEQSFVVIASDGCTSDYATVSVYVNSADGSGETSSGGSDAGGETPDPENGPPDYSDCNGTVSFIADGWCDSSNNSAACGWDGGDCCEASCVNAYYDCGVVDYDCQDPAYQGSTDEGTDTEDNPPDPGDEGNSEGGSHPNNGAWSAANYEMVSDECGLQAYEDDLVGALPADPQVENSTESSFIIVVPDQPSTHCTISGSLFTCNAVESVVEDLVTLNFEVTISGTIVSAEDLDLEMDVKLVSCEGAWCGFAGLGPYPCHTGLVGDATWSGP